MQDIDRYWCDNKSDDHTGLFVCLNNTYRWIIAHCQLDFQAAPAPKLWSQLCFVLQQTWQQHQFYLSWRSRSLGKPKSAALWFSLQWHRFPRRSDPYTVLDLQQNLQQLSCKLEPIPYSTGTKVQRISPRIVCLNLISALWMSWHWTRRLGQCYIPSKLDSCSKLATTYWELCLWTLWWITLWCWLLRRDTSDPRCWNIRLWDLAWVRKCLGIRVACRRARSCILWKWRIEDRQSYWILLGGLAMIRRLSNCWTWGRTRQDGISWTPCPHGCPYQSSEAPQSRLQLPAARSRSLIFSFLIFNYS